MEDWKNRLIEEEANLSEKIAKLESFLKSENYNTLIALDRNDLKEQLLYMRNYRMVLRRRMTRHELIEH